MLFYLPLFDAVFIVTAPLVKKKTWSWSAYLEEERAITAPLKLFKEVRDAAYCVKLVCLFTVI